MKQRFSSLDVKVVAHELSEALVSLRLANIYDLNSKILLLKFAKPDKKHQVLIESGFRCHLTDFVRTAAPAPSNFVARLRKSLKTRRLTSVAQIGTDRIIEFQFSDGAYRLYLEFFAGGNIILTDADLKILALLRIVPEGEHQEPQRVGSTYTLENRQNYGGVPPLTKERLREALETAVQKAAADQASGKKIKKKGADELRRGLATTITELPPILVEHVFRLTSFDPATKPDEILSNENQLDALFQCLEKARDILDEVTSSAVAKGYIIAKRRPGAALEEQGETDQQDQAKNLLYEDFQPFLPKQFQDDPECQILTIDGYNKTVDEFFSSLEGQRLESKLNEREAAAKRKLDAARQDQAKRIEGLQSIQTLNLRKAAAIEANIERVQEAMDAVNSLLQQGMDWVDVSKLVEREQKQHNPVAEIIKLPLKLNENTFTLLLGEGEDEEAEEELDFDYETDEESSEDEDEEAKPKPAAKHLEIDINLGLSPWNNARQYYEEKRTAAEKAQKTVLQSSYALKSAEQKIAEDLKKGLKQEKPILQPVRKPMWFEKFTWFISSDGYLVLGGRDAQQNEILYKRYLRKGDVYVHADLQGAACVVIKNNPKTPDAEIPPSTLAQAGTLSVCCSSAWDSKAGMGAWWVNADQVSKTAPAGEYLPVGSFMVWGKRNLLPPTLLMLGFGLMFKISEQSKAKHARHRIYDASEASTTGAPSETAVAESKDASESGSHAGDASEASDSDDDDEDYDEDHREGHARLNPLQSQTANRRQAQKSGDTQTPIEPPAENLANLHLPEEASSSKPSPVDEEKSHEAAEEEEEEEEEEAEEEQDTPDRPSPAVPSSRAETPSTTSQSTKKAPPKRGQKNKAKKMAAKYKDQDEDDRALMESLMGVTAGRQKAEAEAAAKAQREAEAAAIRERRRLQQERAKQQIAAHEEARRAMLADTTTDDAAAASDSLADLSLLDALVGTPMPGDEILEVIPICAPWNALTTTKFKAKLQPGNTKKGKAVKEIVERWRIVTGKKGAVDEAGLDPGKIFPREAELIKGLKVEEAFNCVPVGKVTVMMAGGLGGGGAAVKSSSGSSSGGLGKGGSRGRGAKKKK
ncbi:fibronectin-binding protein A N-terminus-domain-containing protein [Cercophora scortea]|uniref:Ribosome quality control complex subunit 2 n=1 Tax=Cercophora scortea TaxID=314031 RepID=A0AAE0MLF6_9PEZI|nr:fibronectin-binding protein A N-terminus-domain-containing protein [Cercophora scortea]